MEILLNTGPFPWRKSMSDNIIWSMNREDDSNHVTGYMCMTSWECEIGVACGGNTIYPSIEDLIKCHTCCGEDGGCGIVEVKVSFSRVIKNETF